MKSVPWAIGWEMLHRGRWGLVLAALGANALPVLLFGLLRYDGVLDIPDDPGTIILHMVTVQINLFIFETAVIGALYPMSRLYTFPISTSSLVGWHIVLGMIAVTLEMAASIAILNMCFGLGWRPLGPTLFAGATFSAVLASLWLAEKSGWLPVVLGAAAIPLCLWFKARYGPLFSTPNHYWTDVTFGDAATFAAVPIGAYVVGVFGVTRNRCGSPPYSVGLMAWLQRVFAFGPQTELAFRNPLRAQLWFEWRTKGVALPAIVGMGLFIGFGIWLLSSRNANALFEGCVAGGAMLLLAALLGGFVLGNVGRADRDIQIGQFLATRPLTNTQLANTILKTTAKSVFLGWLLWAIALLIVYATLLALQVNLRVTLPAPLGWWLVPVALVGAWTAAGVMLTLALTGRQNLLAGSIFATITLAVGLMLFEKTMLSPQAGEYFSRGLAASGGMLFMVATIIALVAAHRRQLISRRMLSAVVATWIALCSLSVLFWSPFTVERFALGVLIAGLLALSVAPVATAPMALAWNRTR
jgi:hypothetical protein